MRPKEVLPLQVESGAESNFNKVVLHIPQTSELETQQQM